MNHARSSSALVLAGTLLVLSPGAATAKTTETDGPGSGSGSAITQWRLDVDESTGNVQRIPEWYGGAGLAGRAEARTGGDEAGSGSGSGSSAYDHWSIPAAEAERDEAFLRHWGVDPGDLPGTASGSGNTDLGAARNDIGPAAPAAPAEPATTPITTGIDTDLVVGWTAAAVAAASLGIAAAMFLRRRRQHLVGHA